MEVWKKGDTHHPSKMKDENATFTLVQKCMTGCGKLDKLTVNKRRPVILGNIFAWSTLFKQEIKSFLKVKKRLKMVFMR